MKQVIEFTGRLPKYFPNTICQRGFEGLRQRVSVIEDTSGYNAYQVAQRENDRLPIFLNNSPLIFNILRFFANSASLLPVNGKKAKNKNLKSKYQLFFERKVTMSYYGYQRNGLPADMFTPYESLSLDTMCRRYYGEIHKDNYTPTIGYPNIDDNYNWKYSQRNMPK